MKQQQAKSFVNAQQVADLAGVSRSAVSRTFTDGASVSSQTRKKVMSAAEELGYQVNHLARGLMNRRSKIICIISSDIDAPYQGKFIETLTRQLQATGNVAMLVNASGDTGLENALNLTLQYRADASIVLSGQPKQKLIENCINNRQRVIVVNRDQAVQGTENIVVSNRSSAREAFHMLHRVGCRKLAFVTSSLGTPSLILRETAFVEEAHSLGVEVSIAREGTTTYSTGAEIARKLFSRQSRPDGVFCVTDIMACGFIDVARTEFGISIPEELCVVGFDNIEQSGWSAYNLTTFRQPLEDISTYIASLVGDVPSEYTDEPVQFFAEPVWRKSVRAK